MLCCAFVPADAVCSVVVIAHFFRSFVKQLCSRLSVSLVFIRFSWYNFQPMGLFCFVIHCTFFSCLLFSFRNCSALVSRNIFARVSWCHFYSYSSLAPSHSISFAFFPRHRPLNRVQTFLALHSCLDVCMLFSLSASLCPFEYVISFHCLTVRE